MTRQPILLRGMVRCGICQRKMQGTPIRQDVYYRCWHAHSRQARRRWPDHPRTVNLPEDLILEPLNSWIGRLFDRDGCVSNCGAAPA